MKKPLESRGVTGPQHWSSAGRPGVSEYIRAAERFVQARNYTQALEQLTQAQNYEPANKYIGAIIERVLNLQRINASGSTSPEPLPPLADTDTSRYLTITVDHGYENGIKPDTPPITERNYAELIREFTRIARGYAKLGLPEAAFDALMKAYLLDPVSQDVVDCEKDVVPLWLNSRKHNQPAAPVQAVPSPAPPPQTTKPPSQWAPGFAPGSSSPTLREDLAAEEEELRLEILKQQKELERQEREREIWRDASRVPIMFGSSGAPAGDQTEFEGGFKKMRKGILKRFRRDRPATENG